MPRSNKDFINGAYSVDRGSETKYLSGTGENILGTQSGAKVDIEHPETNFTDYTYFRPSRMINDAGTDYVRDDEGNPMTHTWESYNKVKEGETIPMFHADHRPPVLKYFVSTKDATGNAQALAAHAVEETKRRFGEPPVASSSTSRYSTPLTNAAIRAGIIRGVEGQPAGQEAEVGNDMDWGSSIDSLESARSRYASDLKNPEDQRRSEFRNIDPNVMRTDKVNLAGEALSRRGINPSRLKQSQFDQLSLLDENGKPFA